MLRLADRRGWPINEQFVKHRLLVVATNIAEVKGATMSLSVEARPMAEDSESAIRRIRSKLSDLNQGNKD